VAAHLRPGQAAQTGSILKRRRGRTSGRRLRDGQRRRRDPAAALDSLEARERLTELVGEATIEAALAERHLVPELPPSLWWRLEQMLEHLARLPVEDRPRFCTEQPEIHRRLLVLFVLDHEAIARAMREKFPQ
jgi:hypothetical protein